MISRCAYEIQCLALCNGGAIHQQLSTGRLIERAAKLQREMKGLFMLIRKNVVLAQLPVSLHDFEQQIALRELCSIS